MATDTVTPGTKRRRRQQAQPAPLQPNPAPAAAGAAVAPVRTRRSWGYGAGAIAAIIVGGLVSLFLWTGTQHTTEVWVVSKTVDRGQAITAQDLAVIQVAPNQRTAGFAGPEARNQIIGKLAAVDLPQGSLITRDSITRTLPVPDGKSLVGIALKATQMPAYSLHAGDKVVIAPVAQQNGGALDPAKQPNDVNATIATDPKTDSTSGITIVNVYVSASSASDVAGRSAAGQVTIYLAGDN
jgi:hypothetical protein